MVPGDTYTPMHTYHLESSQGRSSRGAFDRLDIGRKQSNRGKAANEQKGTDLRFTTPLCFGDDLLDHHG